RLRLWWAAGGLAAAVLVTFVADFIGYSTGTAIGIARPMLEAISAPVGKELESFDRRRVAQMVKEIEAGQVAGLGGMEREQVPLELDVRELASAVASLVNLPPPRPIEKDEEKRYVPFQARIPPHVWARALAGAQAHLTGRYR